MRASEFITEAFDQPYKGKWEKSDYGDVDLNTKLPDGTNLSIMFNNQQDDEGKEVVQVEFYRNNSQEVTGEGDAQRIFATVLNAIQKYIKKYKPSRLSFSAIKATDPTIYYEPDQPQPNPESRAKLYDRLVIRYAKAWGYRAFRADNGDLVIYELSRLKQGVAEGATVTRIDSKPVTDFVSGLKAYKHTDDWSQSGLDTGDDSYWKNKNLKTNTTKGLFAGDPRRTALYATGNAHETRYVEFTQNGQPIVYFDQKDLPAMRSRKTYLTVFDAGDFRQLPTGEWFSENPSKPIKQMPIGDPFKYIASQGWIVRVTDDLDKVFKQVKNMHKAGKIAHYGAEGMNESKQGVTENELEEDWKSALATGAMAGAMAMGANAKAPQMVQQIVEPGDTVYSIARQNNVNPLEIYKLNKMGRNTKLEIGQKVIVPDYSKPISKMPATVKPTLKQEPTKVAQPVAQPTTSFKDKLTSMIPKFSRDDKEEEKGVTLLSDNSDAEAALQTAAKAAGLNGVELAQFMAQTRHESWDFGKMKEVGNKKRFAKYEAPRKARQLGNKVKGDGELFKGRGFIQLTGRDNYTRASKQIFGDDRLVKNPDLASNLDVGAQIALWFWKNQVRPNVSNFSNTKEVTNAINPGLSGLQDRHNKFKEYLAVL